MTFKQSTENDIPAMVGLLKFSLGESIVKKTDQIWDYKHRLNPFGKSYVLLAEEDEKLIGLRAFMQWKWQIGTKTWQAYRAVDTATHPDFQGKGIFKKLTLQAISAVGASHDSFIFNTPNNKSRPGYLKMGWVIVDKIKLALVPSFLYWPMVVFAKRIAFGNPISDQQLDSLCSAYNDKLAAGAMLFTPKSAAYLRWRYELNPIQEYTVVSGANWYLAFYLKKHKYFNELRVAELISVEEDADHRIIKKILIQAAVEKGCFIISCSDKSLFSLRLYGSYGPQLTFKDLTNSDELQHYKEDVDNWQYQLGDLELF